VLEEAVLFHTTCCRRLPDFTRQDIVRLRWLESFQQVSNYLDDWLGFGFGKEAQADERCDCEGSAPLDEVHKSSIVFTSQNSNCDQPSWRTTKQALTLAKYKLNEFYPASESQLECVSLLRST